ncbi:MAG: hypothetical protein HY698_01590 [Deltaproteobacteria bacterium]|nr:hypothetical protein [Deltaproteobacteria bacterium]
MGIPRAAEWGQDRVSVASFMEGFVLPLIRGGDVHVGRPIRYRELGEWCEELASPGAPTARNPSSPLGMVFRAQREVASRWMIHPEVAPLGRSELSMLAGLHNALCLAHPGLGATDSRPRLRARLRASCLEFLRVPRPASIGHWLGRHALLHRLWQLRRADTRISWWTGSATLLGEEPPARLLAWPKLRRVRRETTSTSLAELIRKDGVPEEVIRSLIAASPLTDLVTSARKAPTFRFSAENLAVLREKELARGVAHAWLDGASAASPIHLDSAVAAAGALSQLLESRAAAADLRLAVAFLNHLFALVAMAEATLGIIGGSPTLSCLLSDVLPKGQHDDAHNNASHADPRPWDDVLLLLALPDAAARVDPVLAYPPGVADNPDLSRRFSFHRLVVRNTLGELAVDRVTIRLARALGMEPRRGIPVSGGCDAG